MVLPPKYPLEALLEVRQRVADEAARTLAITVRAREEAERALAQAEGERTEAKAHANAVRDREAACLADGTLRALDLARAGAWEMSAQAALREKEGDVAAREESLAAAKDAEVRARSLLSKAKAEHDAVSKDRARFREELRVANLASEDEAAEEVHAAGRSGAR